MVTLGKWEINFRTTKYYNSGDMDDLSYGVMMVEGMRCSFKPTREGLYSYKMSKRTDVFLGQISLIMLLMREIIRAM